MPRRRRRRESARGSAGLMRRVAAPRGDNRQFCIHHATCARGEHVVGSGRVPFIGSQRNRPVPGAERTDGADEQARGVSPVVSRREEWQEQVKLSLLLDKWLDPACTFATATDPVASSAKSGAMRKKRGVKPGLPDMLVLHRGKLVTLELKSRQGRVQPVAAGGTRGAAAGGRRVVGMPLGKRGDVGAAQSGVRVPHARPRRRHDRALAATLDCQRGRCRSATRMSGGRERRSGGAKATAEIAEVAAASDQAAAMTSRR